MPPHHETVEVRDPAPLRVFDDGNGRAQMSAVAISGQTDRASPKDKACQAETEVLDTASDRHGTERPPVAPRARSSAG